MNIIDHGFNKVEIYQIKDIAKCAYAFRSYEEAENCVSGYVQYFNGSSASKKLPVYGIRITDYKKVYEYDEWVDLDEFFNSRTSLLGNVYEKFNLDIPADFNGHSMSVSDLICINEESWYYVDDIGFKYIGDFDYQTFMAEEFRVCTDCGSVIQDGYVVYGGDEYYCEECREKHYSDEEWTRMYNEEYECYYTSWC